MINIFKKIEKCVLPLAFILFILSVCFVLLVWKTSIFDHFSSVKRVSHEFTTFYLKDSKTDPGFYVVAEESLIALKNGKVANGLTQGKGYYVLNMYNESKSGYLLPRKQTNKVSEVVRIEGTLIVDLGNGEEHRFEFRRTLYPYDNTCSFPYLIPLNVYFFTSTVQEVSFYLKEFKINGKLGIPEENLKIQMEFDRYGEVFRKKGVKAEVI